MANDSSRSHKGGSTSTTRKRKRAEFERGQRKKNFAALPPWMVTTLQEDVKELRLSSRLTTSPACIVGDAHDVMPTLDKMYRAMRRHVSHIKRILELNPTHLLVSAPQKAYDERKGDAGMNGGSS